VRRAPAPAVPRIAIVVAVAGLSSSAAAAPAKCDSTLTTTPSTLPAGVRLVRVRIPSSSPELQLRASSGLAGVPRSARSGGMVAEFTADADSPPLVIVAAVGWSFCGFSVVRVGSAPGAAVSPSPVSLVVIDPAGVPGDADTEVRVYVLAVDAHGAPRRGKAPALEPEVGAISGVEAVGPGVWRGRWSVPAEKGEEARIEVVFGSEAPATGSLARTGGQPATVEIEEDRASNVHGLPGAVLIRIRDSAGNPTDAAVEVSSDVATVGAPVRVERGTYRAPLVVPETAGKSFDVVAIAGGIFATATVVLGSAPAATVAIEPRGPILADGSSPGRLVVLPVTVADASGNPAKDVPVGSAELGEFEEALGVGPGSWALPYRPPRVLEDSVDHITVRAGAASGHADLQLLAGGFSGSVGLKLGMVVAGSVGPAVGVEGSAWARVGSAQLGLTLDLGWWTLSQSSSATVGGAASSYFARQNYLPVLLSVAWRKQFARRWLFWASGGGGVAVAWNHSQLGGQPSVSESGLAPAFTASLSAGPRLGPGEPFLELRGTWIGDAHLSTLTGSTFNFLLLFGYRFDVV
jgi:hypothetical protein